MTKAIEREFGPFGITCNTVVPGAINTQRDWSQSEEQGVKNTRLKPGQDGPAHLGLDFTCANVIQ